MDRRKTSDSASYTFGQNAQGNAGVQTGEKEYYFAVLNFAYILRTPNLAERAKIFVKNRETSGTEGVLLQHFKASGISNADFKAHIENMLEDLQDRDLVRLLRFPEDGLAVFAGTQQAGEELKKMNIHNRFYITAGENVPDLTLEIKQIQYAHKQHGEISTPYLDA